jgi:hypothetical protein
VRSTLSPFWKPKVVGLALGGALLAAGSVPAQAALPSAQHHGGGVARFFVSWGAYSGWTYSDLTLDGVFPVNGTPAAGTLKSSGCLSEYGYDPCTAPLSGRLNAKSVTGSCVLTPVQVVPLAPGVLVLGPQKEKLTLACSGTVGGRHWSAKLNVLAVASGDPTTAPPSKPAAPAPYALSYDGDYTAAE